MLGNLNKTQIEELLKTNIIGRIGYHSQEKTYITPISYSYDGENIYCISKEGKKLEIMRANPRVCFEIDTIVNSCNWESVLLWGTFVELKAEEEELLPLILYITINHILFQALLHIVMLPGLL